MVLRSNNNVTFDCTYHVVWCPKYRRPVLDTPGVPERLEQITREVCGEREATIVGEWKDHAEAHWYPTPEVAQAWRDKDFTPSEASEWAVAVGDLHPDVALNRAVELRDQGASPKT